MSRCHARCIYYFCEDHLKSEFSFELLHLFDVYYHVYYHIKVLTTPPPRSVFTTTTSKSRRKRIAITIQVAKKRRFGNYEMKRIWLDDIRRRSTKNLD
jgi:hypothetical protein